MALVISILFAEDNPIINKIRIKLKTYSLKKEIKLFYLDNKKDYYSSWTKEDVTLNMGKDTLFYIKKFYKKYTSQESILNNAYSTSKLDFLAMLSDSDFEYCYKNNNKFRKKLNSFINALKINHFDVFDLPITLDKFRNNECDLNFILYSVFNNSKDFYDTVYLELCIACALFKGSNLNKIVFDICKTMNSKITKEDLDKIIKNKYIYGEDVLELFCNLYVLSEFEYKSNDDIVEIIKNISNLGDSDILGSSFETINKNKNLNIKVYQKIIFIIKISLLAYNKNYKKLKLHEINSFILYGNSGNLKKIKFHNISIIFNKYISDDPNLNIWLQEGNSLNMIKDFIYN